MRFIIRPNAIGKTPRRLKTALGARNCIKVSECVSADYSQDLFLAYPHPHQVCNRTIEYYAVWDFYSSHKLAQRALLYAWHLPIVPTPHIMISTAVYSSYVVRPLRHSQGRDYRVTQDPNDCDNRTHYISALLPKVREYRVLFYKGQHVCTYLKANPEAIPADQPWTHANGCRFQTIHNPQNDRVHTSGLLEQLLEVPLTKVASMVAYDILQTGTGSLYVCEANLCPGLTVQGTIDRIVSIEQSL